MPSHRDAPDTTSGAFSGERMTPAELRVQREFLGLSVPWLAGYLDVSERTVRHWEDGKYQIPDGVRTEIKDIARDAAERVAHGIAAATTPGAILWTYRTDAELDLAQRGNRWPASWHRAVTARILHAVPGLTVRYLDL